MYQLFLERLALPKAYRHLRHSGGNTIPLAGNEGGRSLLKGKVSPQG
jgi:hypothetical protein